MIRMVLILTKASARILKEIVIPRSRVIRLVSVVWAVSDSVPKTPHSLSRFPNMRKPTREMDAGAMKPTIMVTVMGNAIRTILDT